MIEAVATEYTPIHSLDETPASLADFNAMPLEAYNSFINSYSSHVLSFMALADKVSDSQFSDSTIPAHVRVQVPSLSIDLHLPLQLEIKSIGDTITSSIMASKVAKAAQRLNTAVENALAELKAQVAETQLQAQAAETQLPAEALVDVAPEDQQG